MKLTLVIAGLGMGCLLADNEPRQKIQVSNTQRVDFASGKALRLENSTGELMILGWDRPEVEITTIKSSPDEYDARERAKAAQELDQVKFAVDRRGDELVIATSYPRHKAFPPPLPAGARFDLEYYIKAPRDVRLTIAHDAGGVHVDEFTGDISVTARRGEITLRLPGDGPYAIDAKSKWGDVISDFPGQGKFKLLFAGHEFTGGAPTAAHKLSLKIGYGDIIIWKTMRLPAPASPAR
jgi:putative adhesin